MAAHTELTLLHTNDLHDRRSVFAYLEQVERDATTLLLDAGDAIRGSNTVFRWEEPVLDAMSAVGYDVCAFGNRELSYLRPVLRRRLRQARHPYTCANVVDLRSPLHDMWKAPFLRTIGACRVGIIGLTPVQYLPGSPWEPLLGYRFSRPEEAVRDAVASLRDQVDLLVLLSHSGLRTDCRLARDIAGIDLIVGGHSHHRLPEPLWVGTTAIVQTGCHGRHVGRMQLRVGSTSGVEVVGYELVPMPDAESAPWHEREVRGSEDLAALLEGEATTSPAMRGMTA